MFFPEKHIDWKRMFSFFFLLEESICTSEILGSEKAREECELCVQAKQLGQKFPRYFDSDLFSDL